MAEHWKSAHFGLITILTLSYIAVSSTADGNAAIPPAVRGVWWYSYGNRLSWNNSPKTDSYNIVLNCTNSGIHRFNTTGTRFTISTIPRDQCCYGTVYAVNQHGEGPPSTTVAKIGPKVQAGTFQIRDYELQYNNPNTTVTLRWTTKPYPTPGRIFKFVVKIDQQRGRHDVTQTLVCKGPACVYPCDFKMLHSYKQFDQDMVTFEATFDTKPSSVYQVDIKSYTPDMQYGRLIGVRQFTTRDSEPSSPARDVKTLHISQTSVNVSWLEPIEANGHISSYNVKLAYKEQNCSSVPSSVDYYVPKERAETLKTNKYNNYQISDLQPNTQYTLTVVGVNRAGQGLKWSKPFTFTTASRRAPSNVRNVNKTVGKTFVELAWAPPCPLEEPISGYTVELTHRGKVLTTVNTSDTSVSFRDIRPDTFYTVNIQGDNSGLFSRIDVLTKMAASRPTDVEQFEKLTEKLNSQMKTLKKVVTDIQDLKSVIQSKELTINNSFKKALEAIVLSAIQKSKGGNQ